MDTVVRMRTVLAAVVVCLLAAACGEEPPASETDHLGATDACGPVETIPIQGEGHLVGDQEPPVDYNSTPPTSGWHTSGDVAFAVYGPDQALTEPEQVTVLELGGVVISYHDISEQDVATLEQLVAEEYSDVAALTPYDRLDEGEVAMTAWGKVQVCEGVDQDAIAAFVDAYAEPAG